jgi:integrase
VARNRKGGQVKRTLGPVSDWPRKKAEDALRDWLTDLGRLPEEGDAVTFEYAAKAWLRYIETDRQRAASTVTDYRNTMNAYLIPHFKTRSLADISVNDVDALRGELLAKLSLRTTQKALVLVHGIFKLAQRRQWTTTNPAAYAERVRVKPRAEFAVLSPVEVQVVAEATASDQDAALILVAAFTGLRMGELRALRWRDVDFANRIVHVRRSFTGTGEGPPKSGAARSVPLIDQAAVALDGLSRRDTYTGPADRVFLGEHDRPLNDKLMRSALYDAMTEANIDRDRGTGKLFVVHDLRHTFGTLAVQAFSLSDVRAYMGHADIKTTMIYVHHTPQHNAADRLGKLVADAQIVIPRGSDLMASDAI